MTPAEFDALENYLRLHDKGAGEDLVLDGATCKRAADAIRALRADLAAKEEQRNMSAGLAARRNIYLMNAEGVVADKDFDYYGDYELTLHDNIRALHLRAERAEADAAALRALLTRWMAEYEFLWEADDLHADTARALGEGR